VTQAHTANTTAAQPHLAVMRYATDTAERAERVEREDTTEDTTEARVARVARADTTLPVAKLFVTTRRLTLSIRS